MSHGKTDRPPSPKHLKANKSGGDEAFGGSPTEAGSESEKTEPSPKAGGQPPGYDQTCQVNITGSVRSTCTWPAVYIVQPSAAAKPTLVKGRLSRS